nr:LysR family transcriptional regulator [Microbispora rosea]
MDPHLLRTFVTVVAEGSFSAAADRLGYTQPAVSQQIAALEADLGVPLLTRRPVRPTRAGERLLEHAGPLLLRLRAARADVARMSARPRPLTVAAGPLALSAGTAAALSGVTTLRIAGAAEAVALVASGEADLALADGPAAPSDPLGLPDAGPLTIVGVREEELVVVLPEGHPLAGRAGLRLDDLADALWVDAPEVMPLDRLRAVARLDGLRTGMRYEGHDPAVAARLAAAGHGLTLLPASAAVCGVRVPLLAPRIVHRVELVHAALPPGPAAEVVRALTSAPLSASAS